MWFDTHCHLDSSNAEGGAGAIISRAEQAGVGYFVCIGVGGTAATREAVELSESYANVWSTVGVHPHDAASFDGALEAELSSLLDRPRVVALGEVGLDYHYDHSPRARQREVFAHMIAIARQRRKPIVVHTRSAAAETLELLQSESAADVGGIIHCFSEDRAFATRALDLGFDLSFSGIVTFKSARAIQDVALWAPADRILVETDSPYLAPVPLRGRRCEPAFLLHTAAFIASLRGSELSDLRVQTTRNAARRFGLSLEP
ncbi:MAG TPA: TatD family hydrolase [Polyangiaceae bacterium]|nr:TatD family hydrolase [Polyangiaceae bacterium]